MEITTFDIILIIIAAALAVMLIVSHLTTQKRIKRAAQRADRNYADLLRHAESEIRRITTLYNDIKKQSSPQKSAEETSVINTAQLVDVEKLATEQKKLEAQQEELADRNRQLWDMSVAIEKERQHIQELKNDIESQHYAVTSSIRYAKLIQNAVLPSEEILRQSFGDVFLFWRPRDIVSGDFYWMKRIGNTVMFSVADCTGHGVPGAFMSMLGVAFLNEICVDFTPETHPAQVLEELRRKIITTLKQDTDSSTQKDGMDIGLCMLNLANMTMQFAGADISLYHVRGSQITEYSCVRNPVGIYPLMRDFENLDVDVETGDYLYMFSDGFADQFNPENHKFTIRRLRELIVDINTKTKVAAQQAQLLETALDKWRNGTNQMDDILIGGYCIM